MLVCAQIYYETGSYIHINLQDVLYDEDIHVYDTVEPDGNVLWRKLSIVEEKRCVCDN